MIGSFIKWLSRIGCSFGVFLADLNDWLEEMWEVEKPSKVTLEKK